MIVTSKRLYISYMILMTVAAPPTKQKYITGRRSHYAKQITESNDENEMWGYVEEFQKEVTSYLESG